MKKERALTRLRRVSFKLPTDSITLADILVRALTRLRRVIFKLPTDSRWVAYGDAISHQLAVVIKFNFFKSLFKLFLTTHPQFLAIMGLNPVKIPGIKRKISKRFDCYEHKTLEEYFRVEFFGVIDAASYTILIPQIWSDTIVSPECCLQGRW